jgi:osmotically-inducible protein OsmY
MHNLPAPVLDIIPRLIPGRAIMNISRHILLSALTAAATLTACGGGGPDGYYNQMTRDQQYAAARDADTAARVKAAIMADVRITGRASITVHVVDGVAELRGEARSPQERMLANDIAHRTPGVRHVISNLMLN